MLLREWHLWKHGHCQRYCVCDVPVPSGKLSQWNRVCLPHIVSSQGAAEELLTALNRYIGPSYVPRQSSATPHCPAPSFTLALVEKFVSTFTIILSYLYLVYDPTYVTALMSWFFFSSFWPLFNELPHERYLMRAYFEALQLFKPWETECSWFVLGSGLQTSPNSMVPFASLSQDRGLCGSPNIIEKKSYLSR